MVFGTDDGALSAPEGKDVGALVGELWELVKAYVRQEAVDPIRGVGRYVLFGVAGALLVGAGVSLLAIGGLRLLQFETGSTFHGDLSWIPYVIAVVALAGGGVACLAAVGRRGRRGQES